MSDTTKSRKKDSPSITLEDRLTLLQQTVVDYQEAGGKVEIVELHGNEEDDEPDVERVAIVLHNVSRDLHGNLVVV